MVCLLLIINFYVFLFQNVNCSSGTTFLSGAGRNFIEKNKKKQKQNKLFCFHHHHRPTRRHLYVDLQERGKKSRFLLSLLIIGSFRFERIPKIFSKKVKIFTDVKNLT